MEGLPGGRIAYVTKIHHAVADGSAAAEIIVRSLQEDDRPVAFPEREDAGNEAVPSAARHLAGSLRREIVRQQEERSAATSTVTESCPSVRSRPRCATRLNLTAWSYCDLFNICMMAEEFATVFIKTHEHMHAAGAQVDPALLLPDGVHPSMMGHGLIADRWREAMGGQRP